VSEDTDSKKDSKENATGLPTNGKSPLTPEEKNRRARWRRFMRRSLKDPFVLQLCKQMSVWSARLDKVSDEKEQLEPKLHLAYNLLGALVDDFSIEVFSEYEKQIEEGTIVP